MALHGEQIHLDAYKKVTTDQYCGPMGAVVPANKEVNAACKKHDEGYSSLGKRAYFQYNSADEKFIEELDQIDKRGKLDLPGKIARALFKVKRAVAPKMTGTKVYVVEDNTGVKYTQQKLSDVGYTKDYKYKARASRGRGRRSRGGLTRAEAAKLGWGQGKRYNQVGSAYGQRTMAYQGPLRHYAQTAPGGRGRVTAVRFKMPRYRRRRYSRKNKRKFFYKKIKKLARAVARQVNSQTRFWRGQDTGQVQSGLVLTPQTSATNRSITFTKYTLGNANEINDILTETSISCTVNDRVLIKNYSEKWTFVNSHAFPCYLTVYEFYFPQDHHPITGVLAADYTTAAAEAALHNTSAPDDNHITGIPSSGFPLELLWKYNLYRGTNLEGTLADAYRSYLDGTNFGAVDKLTVMNRHHLHTKFKMNGLSKDMKLRKRGVYMLDGGQTSIHQFKRKSFFVSALKQADGGNMHMKGGCGLIFHVTGTLVHEADDNPNDVGRSPIQLDYELKRYCQVDLWPQEEADAFKSYSDRNYTIVTSGEQMDTDLAQDVTKG